MSQLSVYNDSDPNTALEVFNELGSIAERLQKSGILFERWHTLSNAIDHSIEANVLQEQVLNFYSASIQKLKLEGGYLTADVISLTANHPDKVALRKKFLSEHTHSEDEVRFFVEGKGLFSLHIGNRIYCVHCEKGDLISVPAKTKHWFDMGNSPEFTCIRLFTNPVGWIADYTQDNIADQFPRID